MQVRKSIGPFAAPKAVFVIGDLPKTRSGKIMRRILRKILAGEEDQLGDTSTVRTVFSLPEYMMLTSCSCLTPASSTPLSRPSKRPAARNKRHKYTRKKIYKKKMGMPGD